MPVFKVQAPDGTVIKVEATDEATAIRGAQEHYASRGGAPKRTKRGGRNLGESFLSGLAEATAGVADQVLQASPVGAVDTMLKAGANVANIFRGKPVDTPAAPFAGMSRSVQRNAYRPEGGAAKFAHTLGAMTPNALAPGSLAARAVNVFAPTIGAETGATIGRGVGGERGEQVGRVVGGVAGGVAGSVRRSPRPSAANPTAAAQEAMNEVGIDITVLPERTRMRAVRLIEDGRTPEEVAMFVAASEGTPVPVPLRRGDMTGNPVHQHAENMALRGAYGERPAGIMQGQVARQQQALRGNVGAFADEFAGGRARPVGQGATPAAERLSQMRDEAETGVSGAFRAAREADRGSRLPTDQGPVLAQRLREGVEDFDMAGVPRVARELERFDNRGGSVEVRDLFQARTRLNKLTQSTDRVEAEAAAQAKRALDGYIDDAMQAGLIQGDPASVNQWREAIAQRRQMGERFESSDLIEQLTERTFRGGDRRALKVDPGEAANIIFGSGNRFAGKRNLHRDVTRLREVLGPQSGEWNNLRAEAFQRIARNAEGGVEFGERQFSGVKFQKAWQDFLRDDPRLANSLFTAEEQARINNFATIAARVTSPVRGGDNPSNSAVSALKLLPAFLRNLPFIREMANGVNVQVKVNSAVRATNPYPAQQPRPRPTANIFAGATPAALLTGPAMAEDRQRRP